MSGSVFKRCGCTTVTTGPDGSPTRRQLGNTCPHLRREDGTWNPRHGAWGFLLEVSTPVGTQRSHIRQSGHAKQEDAEAAMNTVGELLNLAKRADDPDTARTTIADLIRTAINAKEPLPDADEIRGRITLGQPIDTVPTLATFLREWITGKKNLKATTRRSYQQQIDQYLIPLLGHHRIDRLRVPHVQAAFDTIAEHSLVAAENNAARHAVENASKQAWRDHDAPAARAARTALRDMPPYRRPAGPATIQRIRAALRSALTDAQKQQLITVNTAKLINLPTGRRPKPRVWNDTRVEAWRETGEVPGTVMVWTAPQTTAFLSRAQNHRLYPLYTLVAHCGLRRGEACGLRWQDIDFATGAVEISQQIIQLGWQTHTEDTKSEAGERTVIAVKTVLTALAKERKTQRERRLAHGDGWIDTGLVFTTDNGTPLRPEHLTEQFQNLLREADLPPIRLHDLRHGAATHALTAGIPMKTVSDMLGHSTIAITADTYTSVVDEAKRAAAEAIADLLAA
jgi:integrase